MIKSKTAKMIGKKMKKDFKGVKTSTTIQKTIDRRKDKSVRRDFLSYLKLLIGNNG